MTEPHAEAHRAGFVAVIGRANVGKSTLVNYYAGQKVAITSPKPQTTRRRILAICTTEGAQVVFVDTPGVHQPKHLLGRHMVRTALQAVPAADVVLWIVDVSRPPGPDDRRIAAQLRRVASDDRPRARAREADAGGRGDACVARTASPVLLVMNKMDRLAPHDVKPHTEAYLGLVTVTGWTMTIATEGYNLDELWQMIVDDLPLGPALYPPDQVTDQTERAIAAELIREQVLRYTQQEVPHAVDVLIDEWIERSANLTVVSATVWVERPNQRRIVIGKRGTMLKQIGQAARRELESMLGHGVYLELWVKVREKWRSREADLRVLGYG